MTLPSQNTFWRVILSFTSLLAVFAIIDTLQLAEKLQVGPLTSKTILGMLAFYALIVIAVGSALALTFSRFRQSIISTLEAPSRAASGFRFGALAAFLVVLLAFPVLYSLPAIRQFFSGSAARFLVFWILALVGMYSFKIARPPTSLPAALGATLISLSAVNLAASYLPAITDYPFALGWSETSRFYFPSLFLSQKIYGQPYPWPILHPSLHLLLTPPYWVDGPLWLHRAWQVGIRFLMVGLIGPALLSRFKIEKCALRFFLATWIFVYLFILPLYLHLPLMVFPLLWLFRAEDDRRSWVLLIAASIWAGLSRLNWYPMPGLILSALWLLESGRGTPRTGQKPLVSGLIQRFWRPALWTIFGSGLGYAVSQVYVRLSGNQPGDFFTSLTSDLLWYRLWPNATYGLGILPGIILLSLPLWALILWSIKKGGGLRDSVTMWAGIFAILLALFVGGIFVSMKIGGGADLHNMDAYGVMLLIVAAYALYRSTKPIPWQAAALLVLIPAWFGQQASSGIVRYDPALSQAALTAIQERVDMSEGEILFITQRHLIAMKMLNGVRLIPEYEREDLMEMAMANNTAYLERFERDLERQRFAAIVVDPLRFNLLGSEYAMGEENNAWARRVARPVLCWYEQSETFPADRIVIYVPRKEGRDCPTVGD